MRKSRSGVLLSLSLVMGGVVLAVLLFAFVTRNWNGAVEPLSVSAPAGTAGGVYQVEIRNGCGIAGLARDLRNYLRKRGFDVVESGNYTDFEQEVTRVIDRAGNLEGARQLARTLGIDESTVTQDIATEAYLDATVIIGHDYTSLRPFGDSREGVVQR